MKANTLIPIYYDREQSKVCMMNVTTRQFYFHYQSFEQISTLVFLGVVLVLNGLVRRSQLHFHLTHNFKILLILVSILVGILSLLLFIKKRYQPLFTEYMRRKPYPEEVKSTDDITKILGVAQSAMLMLIIFSIGMLIWSMVLFKRFLSDSSLATYTLATSLLLGFLYFFSRIDHAIFTLKLVAEIKSKDS